MWRGKNPESRMGIRVFCEKVIEETLQPFIDGDINCWLRRARKRPRNLEKVFYKRFSGKPVKNCTPLELRNDLGPAAADPNFDLGKHTLSEKSRLRASQCMDFMVRKSTHTRRRKCVLCGVLTPYSCEGGRCNVWAYFFRRSTIGSAKDTRLGKCHTRFFSARKRLKRAL